FASQFLPAGANVLEGELYPEMNVSGDRSGLDWNHSRFHMKGRGLRMRVPEYTEEVVGPVAFEAELTSNTLRVPIFDLQAGEDRLQLQMAQASLLGQGWEDGLSVGGQWMLNADLASVLKRVQAHGALPNLELSGKADGDGVIIGKWIPAEQEKNGPQPHWALRLRDELQSLLRHIQLTGNVSISDGRGFHHLLPAPVRGVNGRIEMAGNTLRATDLTGSMLGSDVVLSARLEGDEQLWIDPQMRFDLQGDVQLKDAEEVLQSEVLEMNWPGPYRREVLKRLHPSGSLNLDLHVTGPLMRPLEMRPAGRLTASDIAVDITSDLSNGTLFLKQMRMDIHPDIFSLTRFEGTVNDIVFSTTATLNNRGLEIFSAIDSPFKELEKAFPPAFKYAREVGGRLFIDGRASARLRPDLLPRRNAVPETPLELIAALPGLLPTDNEKPLLTNFAETIGGRFDYDYHAAVDIEDGIFAHGFMPNRVTEINGRVFVFPLGIRTDGFCETKWGSSQQGLTSATVRVEPVPQLFSPDPQPSKAIIRFESSAPDLFLDEWITNWGPGRMRPNPEKQKPRERVEADRFDYTRRFSYPMQSDIQGDIRADTLFFRRFRFVDASTRLSTQYYRNRDSILSFDDTRASGYGGAIASDIALFMPIGKLLEWQWQARMDGVNVQPLLTAVYGEDATIIGTMDSWLDLRAVGGDQETFTGKGAVHLNDSQFMNIQLFRILGDTLNLKGLSDASFTNMDGEFTIAQGWIWIQRLVLDSALFDFVAVGRATLGGKLDLTVAYIPLGMLQDVPVLKYIPRAFSTVTDRLLKVRLSGTINDPNVRMLAPSVTLPPPPQPEQTEDAPRPPLQLMEPMEEKPLETLTEPVAQPDAE
ncbi:MAG: AsmA-like C-terminal region-containing protein, partial [Candidatus Sumerlaeota bacterium]